MSKKLKIGVFGGARGFTMMRVLFSHPDAELAAVCDKYEPLLDRVKEKAKELNCEVACYTDFEDFIKHPGLDAVVLANYANEHAVYAVRCMKEGKHVLSEVLPCETLAQAVELIETVEETGLVYAYAENYCYMQHSFEMQKRYQAGDIGEVMYAEGEYIHDGTVEWLGLTYCDENHWRNRTYATFYCTHSLGPLMTITGLRPKSVVGFEVPPVNTALERGCVLGTGIEMVTMENGAVFRSLHGGMKREPISVNYLMYGQKGMMESGRFDENKKFNIYIEGPEPVKGDWEHYDSLSDIAADLRDASGVNTHDGSDFYPTHFFIEKILGRENGKYSIDVYTAVDMGICGILAYRSVLAGNISIDVPDLRDKAQRDAFRNDNASTNPAISHGDELLPVVSDPKYYDMIDKEKYEAHRQAWFAQQEKKA